MTTPKESIYDDRISPLMSQIIEICKEHKIANICHFALGWDEEEESDLACTTAMLEEDFEPTDSMLTALDELRPRPATFMTSMIVTKIMERVATLINAAKRLSLAVADKKPCVVFARSKPNAPRPCLSVRCESVDEAKAIQDAIHEVIAARGELTTEDFMEVNGLGPEDMENELVQ